MAVTESGLSVAGDAKQPGALARARGTGLWMMAVVCVLTIAAIVLGLAAGAYQPLGFWNPVGGFPGLHRAVGARTVNDFGGETGELYIPHQRGTFAAAVSLVNTGRFPVTIEAVSLLPPHVDDPRALSAAGPALYWTIRMTTGLHPKLGRPIAGLTLEPGDEHGIYVAVPVRTPRCYMPTGFQVLSYFYVQEQFGPFTRWARVPLMQPLLLNVPAEPPSDPHAVCPGQR